MKGIVRNGKGKEEKGGLSNRKARGPDSIIAVGVGKETERRGRNLVPLSYLGEK